jgi:hypothetical protein
MAYLLIIYNMYMTRRCPVHTCQWLILILDDETLWKKHMVNVWSSTQKKHSSSDPHPNTLFWHSFWHSFWHIFWHSIWNSFWHLFWHSIYLTYALASILIFFLAIYGYLTYALAFYRGPAALGARDMASVDASHELAEEKAEEGVAP